jgi:hypothetical protein
LQSNQQTSALDKGSLGERIFADQSMSLFSIISGKNIFRRA